MNKKGNENVSIIIPYCFGDIKDTILGLSNQEYPGKREEGQDYIFTMVRDRINGRGCHYSHCVGGAYYLSAISLKERDYVKN